MKPIIFFLDDDQAVLNSVVRDAKSRYRKNYRIIGTTSANEALDALRQFNLKGENIALFISDQKMPEMLGVDFLEKAKIIYPDAKRILLTAYSDIDAAIRAINDVQLDYYLTKPWDPPEEKLFPVLDDMLDEWSSTYIPLYKGIKVVGYQWSPKSHGIKDFLAGNLVPYKWLDFEQNQTEIKPMNLSKDIKLPIVIFEDGEIIESPELVEIAKKIGMQGNAKHNMYDVAIIGAGPAGLAASVYGGSEGLNTILIEKRAPGGQAGTSSRIENYLGFPKGLSGAELSRRAVSQASRFGIEILSPHEVVSIHVENGYKVLELTNGDKINTRSIVITTGVSYRKHEALGIDDFTGAGVYYGAASTEASAIKGKDIYIVGGGNSAGQAAMYLSKFAKTVNIVIRKPDLSSSMSQYLIDQIAAQDNIQLVPNSEIISVNGKDKLEEVTLRCNLDGKESNRQAVALFIFIGAKPKSDWEGLEFIKDSRGFIETGSGLKQHNNYSKVWKEKREPFLLETCVPGVFAAGDVRSGAMNRVASAVGEGSMAIKFVHQYLSEN